MRNVWAVVKREYLQRVRSKWFVFSTLGVPVGIAAMILVPAWFGAQSGRTERTLVVVDGSGFMYDALAPRLEAGGFTVRRRDWSQDVTTVLEEMTRAEEIGGFLVLDDETLRSGDAQLVAMQAPSALRRFVLANAVTRTALEVQLEARGVDPEGLLSGGDLDVQVLSEEAGLDDPRGALGFLGSFFLYFVILIYAVAVMRSTLEEKTSRVAEVIVSAMKPWHLLLGKILGVGAVSLTQVAVWAGMVGVALTAGLPMLIAARPELATLEGLRDVAPGAGLVLLFVGLFVFGFFMYSGLYAAVGAMCNTDEEAQQAQVPVMLFLVAPAVLLAPVLDNPGSTMAVTLSLFPLFSPVLLFGRVAAGAASWWQIAVAFVGMALMTVAIAWVAGRIYKVGILMAGKRPTLPELVRWVREA